MERKVRRKKNTLHVEQLSQDDAMISGRASRSWGLVAAFALIVSLCFCVKSKFETTHDKHQSASLISAVTLRPANIICSEKLSLRDSLRKPRSGHGLGEQAEALSNLYANKKAVASYIKNCVAPATLPASAGTKLTTGIVIPAGGKALLSSAIALLTVVRETLKSHLPVEVVYNGQEEYEALLVSQLHVGIADIPDCVTHNNTVLSGMLDVYVCASSLLHILLVLPSRGQLLHMQGFCAWHGVCCSGFKLLNVATVLTRLCFLVAACFLPVRELENCSLFHLSCMYNNRLDHCRQFRM